jgi:preprotein translocase subunit SecG
MYGFLLAVLVLDGLFLSVVILLQAGKGGGLAAVGGSGGTMTEGVLGGRQATTVLTRATWTAGTIFMVLALVLSILSSRAHSPTSVIQVNTPASQTAPEPVLPGVDGQTAPQGAPPPGGGAQDPGNDGN